MTNATVALTELTEEGADFDVLHQIVQFMAQRLIELDVDARAAPATTRTVPSGLTAATATASAAGTPSRHLPQRRLDQAACRRHDAGAKR